MYSVSLILHSLLRWLVVALLIFSIVVSGEARARNRVFNAFHNSIRHWTATLAHVQLLIGIFLYNKSDLTSYFWKYFPTSSQHIDTAFFGLFHPIMMFAAVLFITIGSSVAKRKPSAQEKFKAMFLWFMAAFVLLLIAIPWPFSPLANRPFIRPF